MNLSNPMPADLEAHLLNFPGMNDQATEIRLLSEEESSIQSIRIQEFVPIANRMGLIVLDDANTSDYHCYITAGPAVGMILNLPHDGEPELAFNNLAKYLKEIRRLIREEEFIDAIMYDFAVTEATQVEAADFVNENFSTLLSEELYTYLPLLSSENTLLMERLSQHHDYFVREFTAIHLTKNPARKVLHVAEKLAADDVAQVSSAGIQAVTTINQL